MHIRENFFNNRVLCEHLVYLVVKQFVSSFVSLVVRNEKVYVGIFYLL